jgi:beta-glucosidase
MAQSATPTGQLELDHGFVVGTGIECSAPTIAGGHRQDELVMTGHWIRYAEDLALVAAFGIRYLRYGVPFHVVAREPNRFDWTWTDSAFGALRDAGLEPIADLLHFGVPDDIRGIGDPAMPARFLDFAAAFAERYPWVRWYTPVNEPLVTARFSAQLGWWNERRTDERSFVRALDNVVTCAVGGMAAIRQRRADAAFLQSDACESYLPAEAAAYAATAFLNERRFVGWDLTYGRRPAEPVVTWLTENGLGEDRLAWFAEHGSSEGCIVGHDYYAGNEWLVDADGATRQVTGERRGYAAVAREHDAHFGLPFMLSETNWEGPAAAAWLARTWNDTLQLRREGVPIRGYIWYGFVDHVDWDSALRVAAGTVNACGLVDLDRQPHPWGEIYRDLARAAARGELLPLDLEAVDGRQK